MKAIHSMIAALGLAFVQPAPANAAVTDPEVIIYRFPGVIDNGGGTFTGVATLFICTNFSGAPETIRFATRGSGGGLITNIPLSIDHLQTRKAATHGPMSYGADILLNTPGVFGGTTAIAATSINIICTGMAINASTEAPVGVALRGIRFNPVPGSQE